jgi:hypothetical protein
MISVGAIAAALWGNLIYAVHRDNLAHARRLNDEQQQREAARRLNEIAAWKTAKQSVYFSLDKFAHFTVM